MAKTEEKKETAKNENAKKSLPERSREIEEDWRAKHGLSKGLHRKRNTIAGERRRQAECPKEPKAAVRYRRYRKKQLGKLGPASRVRRIDIGSDGQV